MRLLFVTTTPPSLLRPRTLGFVRTLAQRHAVSVLALCHTPRDITEAARIRSLGAQVTPIFEESGQAKLRLGAALLREQPLSLAYAASPRLSAAVARELASGTVALIHAEGVAAATVAQGALRDACAAGAPTGAIPCVWDASEVGDAGGPSLHAPAGSAPLNAWNELEARRLAVWRRAALGAASHTLVGAEGERRALLATWARGHATDGQAGERATPPISVVASGVDLEYFAATHGRRHRNRIVLSGDLRAPNGLAAARRLVHAILPRVWRARPDVCVTLAGDNPPDEARRWAEDSRITVTGYAPDQRPYLAGAALALCLAPENGAPASLPQSLLEALALETPVVASDAFLGALGAIPGRDLLVAGSNERFAQLTLRLLGDEALQRTLGRNGRAFVERRFAWPLVTRRLEAIYSDLTGADFTQPTIPTPAGVARWAHGLGASAAGWSRL